MRASSLPLFHKRVCSRFGSVSVVLTSCFLANRRFVEVVVRSRKRFKALRDFTVEGAIAELDRHAQERKDRGESAVPASGIRSPGRKGSLDSTRSPASARSPQLGNVPENEAFAIGDDEEDEDGESGVLANSTSLTTPLSASSSNVAEEAVPLQSRSMSEKARGKQPVGQGSFSRSTSRNTSTTSLPALITPQAPTPQSSLSTFRPTPEWVCILFAIRRDMLWC